MNDVTLPTARDVWVARNRISNMVERTPVLPSNTLSSRTGSRQFMKWETMHPTGAFKIRGAANKIAGLPEETRKLGVATFSTGNHGLSVAHVAGLLGCRANVFVSSRVPKNKREALERFGAELHVGGGSQDDAERSCYAFAEEQGCAVVPPFDDPDVICGQGTIGLELMEALPELDALFIPLSGGGLIAGVALAVKAVSPRCRVYGVSMERGAVMHESLRAGKPVVLEEVDTLADSLLGGIGSENKYTFSLVRDLVDDTFLVSEAAIAEAMAFLFREHHVVVEGAAAVGPAAILQGVVDLSGKTVASVITGNNVDVVSFLEAVRPYLRPS